jgi:alcohol dehydrogenase (cytochrome c)
MNGVAPRRTLGATAVEKILDPVEDARGRLTAFDADAGEVRWKFQTPRPVDAAVTPTAGGLVFTADLGGRFYAFDATTGRVLWQHEMGQSTGGGFVTYLCEHTGGGGASGIRIG